ncbi:hypothetical protein ACQPXT_13305 [Streptomyces sp. CA-100214]
MSGAAATPRVDVEALLLCDVLPDGTVAGLALVEPIYDTISGDRVGTRTVDPVTGAAYTPTGTLQPCQPDGCNATTSSLVLCDTAGDGTVTHFVRTTLYDCEGALLSTLDRTLDGTAYTVTGTVGVCPVAPDCESPTTPVTSVGLCLADGTPIAVTVVRDCTGAVTSEGWINLSTGAWSAGAVPAGTVACGESRSIQVSGTFCDVDAGGEVVGLVLVEYTYDDSGAIASVRLVDAVTGGTYTPTGTITVCPAGVEQPERDLVQLCDVAADGTSTPFVRDYGRDENGAISGHSDYLLDGTAYAPTGTVGVCAEPCTTQTSLVLCDSTAVELGPLLGLTETDPTPLFQPSPPDGNVKRVNLTPGQPFFDGGSVTFAPPPGGEGTGTTGTHRYIAASITADAVACPPCGPAGDVTITVTGRACNQGPAAGVQTSGRWRLLDSSTSPATELASQTISNVGSGGVFPACRDLSVTATVAYDKLLSGDLAISLDLETHDENLGEKTWIADQFGITATLAPVAGCGTQFLRTIRAACDTGEVLSVVDTDLSGAPYTVSGDVGTCQLHASSCGEDGGVTEPCRSSTVLALCDVTEGGPIQLADRFSFTDVDPTVTYAAGVNNQPALVSGQPFWDGGTVTISPPPGGEAVDSTHRNIGARIGLVGAGEICNPPTDVTLTLTCHIVNDGPAAGQAICGRWHLHNGTTVLAIQNATSVGVGGARDLSVSGVVPWADLIAGNIAIGLDVETQHFGVKSWTADQFAVTVTPVEVDRCDTSTGEVIPFLRAVVTDCATGETVSTTDTTLDGALYTPVGAVGACSGSSSSTTAGTEQDVVELCDVQADGTVVTLIRDYARDAAGAITGYTDYDVDGAPYTAAGTVGACGQSSASCGDTQLTQLCDVTAAPADPIPVPPTPSP